MRADRVSQAFVAKHVILDGRLALFHERERWLAVADLHFGYELSQRAAGNLFPLWGMQTIEDASPGTAAKLQSVTPGPPGRSFARCNRGGRTCFPDSTNRRVLPGRVDQQATTIVASPEKFRQSDAVLAESWQSNGFYFHHGDCSRPHGNCIEVIGHHHPAGVIRDGAGLRLKLPAFVQRKNCWIMPAFSPWAAGTEWRDEKSRMWLCSPGANPAVECRSERSFRAERGIPQCRRRYPRHSVIGNPLRDSSLCSE